MEINDETKRIGKELGSAINQAIENSAEVADAIERLRRAGYETELKLRLQIGLRQLEAEAEEADMLATLELTDEDRRTLKRMKIRFDDAEDQD
ncbi:MAG: hypothetical protein H0V88_05765 [Pyrinomonadaceae bacterium]|nr:hypothetical protein [Pyrinomonadaceae bacterium]